MKFATILVLSSLFYRIYLTRFAQIAILVVNPVLMDYKTNVKHVLLIFIKNLQFLLVSVNVGMVILSNKKNV